MVDRFNLEEDILGCWGVVDDLKAIAWKVRNNQANEDEIIRLVEGLSELYQIKFEKAWETFTEDSEVK